MNKRGKISRAEIIILAVILASAVALFTAFNLQKSGANTAEISFSGTVYSVSIEQDREFTLREISGGENAPDMTFEVNDGEIAVISSDCPGNDCVHSGFIPGGGRVIICVPNRVTVTVSDENIAFDAVL
jgi:hypothetical protein